MIAIMEEISRIAAALAPLGYEITGFKNKPGKYIRSFSYYSFTIHLSPSSKREAVTDPAKGPAIERIMRGEGGAAHAGTAGS